jgi:hypothetical protein
MERETTPHTKLAVDPTKGNRGKGFSEAILGY